jgi:hypothetical protein
MGRRQYFDLRLRRELERGLKKGISVGSLRRGLEKGNSLVLGAWLVEVAYTRSSSQ